MNLITLLARSAQFYQLSPDPPNSILPESYNVISSLKWRPYALAVGRANWFNRGRISEADYAGQGPRRFHRYDAPWYRWRTRWNLAWACSRLVSGRTVCWVYRVNLWSDASARHLSPDPETVRLI